MLLVRIDCCPVGAQTQGYTYSVSTCGMNVITNETACTAAAATLGYTWVSEAAGSEWASGCIFHGGSVYFSPIEDGSTENPTDAYICHETGETGHTPS
jgi:hypothetical protein